MVDTPPNDHALRSYWMPFTANRAFKARPRLMASAKGLHYLTPDGRKVLDATSGLYCVNAGHGQPAITEAIKAAAERLDYAPAFQFAHPAVFELAERLVALAPQNLAHVLFATSGSEAVETAMKLALSYHRETGAERRTRFIGRERGYHGVCFGGTSVGGIKDNRTPFPALLPGVDHMPTTYDRDHQAFSAGEPEWGAHLADDLERVVAMHGADTIAAVIVEPVAGSTGCLPPPKGYLKRLRALASRHGFLLIFDEVITGFGRLGYAFAAERYKIEPDMICFAKGVTNGAAPLSGIFVSAAIHDAHMHGPDHAVELFHGHTYSGHPLSVAAALAALDVYRSEDLFKCARALEPLFAETMLSLKDIPLIADIRPIGMMCGIDVEPAPGGPGLRGYEIMEKAFHDEDLYVRVAGDCLVVAPPLIADEKTLTDIRDRIARLLG
jgi:beta-alanine--pyruvate transaminase